MTRDKKKPARTQSIKVKHPYPGVPHGQAKGPNAKPSKPRKTPPMRNRKVS